MDPLTHMLAGAAVADLAAAPTRLGKGALIFAMALAAAPDLDVLPAFFARFPSNPFANTGLFDPALMREWHRSWTHALPVQLAAGGVLGLAAFLLNRKTRLGLWVLLAWLALASHTLLDMANGAVQLWLPFRKDWIGWMQLYEPAVLPITVAFLFCFLANHLFSFQNTHSLATLVWVEKFSQAMQRVKRKASPTLVAFWTLLFSAAYIMLMSLLYP